MAIDEDQVGYDWTLDGNGYTLTEFPPHLVYIDVLTYTTKLVNATPSLMNPEIINRTSDHISYSAGVFYFKVSGTYDFVFLLNPATDGAGIHTFWTWAEVSTDGTNWTQARSSLRRYYMPNNSESQILFTSGNRFDAGTYLRFPIRTTTGDHDMAAVDLPGSVAGTLTVPAIRIMITGKI
jgi:hypothetical protein